MVILKLSQKETFINIAYKYNSLLVYKKKEERKLNCFRNVFFLIQVWNSRILYL